MSLEAPTQLLGQGLSFEAVIELIHAEEQADTQPKESDLILTPGGKRASIPLYSMQNPDQFEIVKLDLQNE